ncbi:MAG: exopolyphosphatase [Cytophagales bacterium]|nr:exopolyphosphatase [Cytophagales bacterium]
MNKVAIIDMGTNTFHLLVAEVNGEEFKITHREKAAVKLGVGGINRNLITTEAQARALHTMKAFRNTLNEMGIDRVHAFGTSALRNASNGLEVATRIEGETGIKINIISGLQEAEYICQGARAAIAMGAQKHLVMDIGGGSVEFIIANHSEIFWSNSFEIGGQRLLERFQKHDPIHPDEVNALFAYFESELRPLLNQLKLHRPTTLIGSSGTFDTLSDIYCFRNNMPVTELPETPFALKAFDSIYEEILFKDRAARMQIPGMIEMRVEMIVVACCLIKYLLQAYRFEALRVSSYSLKEGALVNLR